MKITPSRQRNAVSEGMALGMIMCGRDELPADKLRIDLSFERAWRNWPYRDRFSQVDTDLRNGSDGIWVMTHADENKRVWNLFWTVSRGKVAIHGRSQWVDDEIDPDAIASGIAGDVPASGWRAFAEEFLTRFDR